MIIETFERTPAAVCMISSGVRQTVVDEVTDEWMEMMILCLCLWKETPF